MADAVVLLTPVLVLGVLLLLGFAGCSFEAPVGSPTFSFRVRVPAALTVTEIVYRATKPGGGVLHEPVPNPVPASTEGDENIFYFADGEPLVGAWTVSCRVTVRENGDTGQDGDQAEAVVDGSDDFPTATFRATGKPSAGFDVTYTGLT